MMSIGRNAASTRSAQTVPELCSHPVGTDAVGAADGASNGPIAVATVTVSCGARAVAHGASCRPSNTTSKVGATTRAAVCDLK